MATKLPPFTYVPISEVPKGYCCSKCKATRCKLWRQYQTTLEHVELLCGPCALKDQKHEDWTLDEKGMHWDPTIGVQKCDQIGWLVPAIPTEDGFTFWGYTSVPQPGVDWWHRLQTYPQEKK